MPLDENVPMASSYMHILKYFNYAHLPPALHEISAPCCDLAYLMLEKLPSTSPELEVGLRKLLEAKDCFVRAALP